MADKRLEKIAGSLETMKIGLDGAFNFNVTKALGLSTMELFGKYCEDYIGPDSRIPIVRLIPKGATKRCPLLKNRKCMVHRQNQRCARCSQSAGA